MLVKETHCINLAHARTFEKQPLAAWYSGLRLYSERVHSIYHKYEGKIENGRVVRLLTMPFLNSQRLNSGMKASTSELQGESCASKNTNAHLITLQHCRAYTTYHNDQQSTSRIHKTGRKLCCNYQPVQLREHGYRVEESELALVSFVAEFGTRHFEVMTAQLIACEGWFLSCVVAMKRSPWNGHPYLGSCVLSI